MIGRPRETNDYFVDGDVVVMDISTRRHVDAWTIFSLQQIGTVLEGGGRWFATADGRRRYACRKRGSNGRQWHERLHRLLCGLGPYGPLVVDHADGNGLNNLPENLRATIHPFNVANAPKRKGDGGLFKGVYERSGRYVAAVRSFGILHRLGTFDSQEEAARAYDDAARKLFGEFANTNFKNEDAA